MASSPATAGTAITVFRCDDRSRVPASAGSDHGRGDDGRGQRRLVGCRSAGQRGRGLGLPGEHRPARSCTARSASARRRPLRSGRADAVTFAPVEITPATEAAVELLDHERFRELFRHRRAEVLSAVEQATADLSFDGLTPEMATQLAVQTASERSAGAGPSCRRLAIHRLRRLSPTVTHRLARRRAAWCSSATANRMSCTSSTPPALPSSRLSRSARDRRAWH